MKWLFQFQLSLPKAAATTWLAVLKNFPVCFTYEWCGHTDVIWFKCTFYASFLLFLFI